MGVNSMKIVGIDLSLTGTGIIVLENGAIVHQSLIKSKTTTGFVDEVKRLRRIVDEIMVTVKQEAPYLVLIEGLAFMARNTTALVQLAGLNYLLRSSLVDNSIPFIIVAPSTLKKFVTGKGSGPKDVMMLETFKRWGVTLVDNNICDAYGLAKIGEALVQIDNKKHWNQLTKPQQEVVKLLVQQFEINPGIYAKT